ncbi:MAG TPA: hypothetical protein VFH54_05755 [Mycobacteriales bacterium]|nr:hypothetical protein [Mycobacteriales bacterium]
MTKAWPASLCTPTDGPTFTTTTTADQDLIRVEPASAPPHLTQQQAYAKYLQLFGHPTRQEAPQMQIRYGVLTDGVSGSASANDLDAVPLFRRTRAWVISACDSPRPSIVATYHRPQLPHHGEPPLPPDGGLLVVYIADSPTTELFTGWYLTGKSTQGLGGIGASPDNPAPTATSYLSVPWREVARDGNRVLLRYTPKRCFTLDHTVVEPTGAEASVIVILSDGPGHTCPTPSATQPYIQITTTATQLKHGRLGPLQFMGVRA